MTRDSFYAEMQAKLAETEHPEFIWVAISPADRPRYYASEEAMQKYFKTFDAEFLSIYKFAKYRLVLED